MNSRKAIIYLRVSTEEQGASGLGLEAQEFSARQYCERQGFEILEIVREIQSGTNLKKRPLLRGALERCRRGEAGVLVAANVSRLSRSILDLSEMLEDAERQGFGIAAIDTGLDTTTPAGKMVFQILGVAAEYERAMLSDRTKKALDMKRARGEQIGRPSQLTPGTATLIATLRQEGKSLQAIANELNERALPCGQGGKQWYGSSVRKVLLSRQRASSFSMSPV